MKNIINCLILKFNVDYHTVFTISVLINFKLSV